MISIATISLFFMVLFLTVFLFDAIWWGNNLTNQRIARRLRGSPEDKETRIQLEKMDRLSQLPALEWILKKVRLVKNFQLWIRQSGLPLSAGTVILMSFLIGSACSVLAMFLKLGLAPSAVATLLAMILPLGFVALMRSQRIKKFSEIFPHAVSRMASALRTGYSLQMAFEAVVEDLKTIVAQEFKNVLAEMEVGQNFEEALKKMLERVDTPELRLFISSVIIQRESGGNLAELLDNLETTIRERFALQRELRAATAQAKLSGLVLSLLPIFVGFLIYLVHRDYILFFFQDPLGKQLLWLCIAGQVLGFFVIRQIIHIRM